MRRALLVIHLLAAPAAAEPTAYLATPARGLLRVDGKRLIRVAAEPRLAYDVRRGAGGSLFVLGGFSVWRIDGGGPARIGGMLVPGPTLFLDVSPAGELWVANQRDVSAWVDGAFHTRLLPDAPNGVSDFAVDGGGDAWLRNGNQLFRARGDLWEKIEPPQPEVKHCKLGRGPDIVLACWETVWQRDGSTWRAAATVPRLVASHVVLDAQGWVTMTTFHHGRFQLVILPSDGSEPRSAPRTNAETYALEVDARGRAWVATSRGVELYDREARAIAPRWLARAGEVRGLLILGDGPDLGRGGARGRAGTKATTP